MDRETKLLGIALILMLVAFPVLSAGTEGDRTALWGIGLGLVAVAGVVPPLLRYLDVDDGDEEDDGEENDEGGGNAERGERTEHAED